MVTGFEDKDPDWATKHFTEDAVLSVSNFGTISGRANLIEFIKWGQFKEGEKIVWT